MTKTALQIILDNTFSKSDFYERIDIVEEYLEQGHYSAGGYKLQESAPSLKNYTEEISTEEVASFVEEWSQAGIFEEITEDNFYEKVRELKKDIEMLPELVLYVPVSLHGEDTRDIGRWCRKELSEQVMLSFIIEPNAVGGCAFAWNGQYHDYSLQYYLSNSDDLVANLIKTYDAK